jgi:hypothetical protein
MRYDEKMEHYGKTELEQLREENQRLREAFAASNETNDNLLCELEDAYRQAKIEVLEELLSQRPEQTMVDRGVGGCIMIDDWLSTIRKKLIEVKQWNTSSTD